MKVTPLLRAAQSLREAIRHLETEIATSAEHSHWPQNRENANRLLAAIENWDSLVDDCPTFPNGDLYIVGVHGPAPLPQRCQLGAMSAGATSQEAAGQD